MCVAYPLLGVSHQTSTRVDSDRWKPTAFSSKKKEEKSIKKSVSSLTRRRATKSPPAHNSFRDEVSKQFVLFRVEFLLLCSWGEQSAAFSCALRGCSAMHCDAMRCDDVDTSSASSASVIWWFCNGALASVRCRERVEARPE